MINRQPIRELSAPSQDQFVLPLPHRTLRIRWSRLLIACGIGYLAVMSVWGAAVTLQLSAQKAALVRQVQAEQAANTQLQKQISAYSGAQGRQAAIQSQFDLVPAGQIPVKVPSTSQTGR